MISGMYSGRVKLATFMLLRKHSSIESLLCSALFIFYLLYFLSYVLSRVITVRFKQKEPMAMLTFCESSMHQVSTNALGTCGIALGWLFSLGDGGVES